MKIYKIISFILLILIKCQLNAEKQYIDIDYENSIKKPKDSELIYSSIKKDETQSYSITINKDDLKDFFLEINLIILAGNAHMDIIPEKDNIIEIDKNIIDNNEIYIIKPKNKDNSENTIEVTIYGKEKSLFIYSYKFINSINPTKIYENNIQVSFIDGNKKERVFILQHLERLNNNKPYYSTFIPINCEIEVTSESRLISKSPNGDYIDIVYNNDPRFVNNYISYTVKQNSKIDKCFFYILSGENFKSLLKSQFTLPIFYNTIDDSKTLKIPYIYSKDDGNINIKLNMFTKATFNVDINIQGYETVISTIMGPSSNFVIKEQEVRICKNNNYCNITIILKPMNKLNRIIPMELIFISSKKKPIILRKNSFKNIVISQKDMIYFGIPIEKNEEGEVKIDYKRGNGKMFAKLWRIDTTDTSWYDMIKLPNEFDTKGKGFEYDSINKILKYTKISTENCYNKGCFLFIGIKSTDEYANEYSIYNFEFNIYVRTLNLIKFITIPLNELITGVISKKNDTHQDYYEFKFDYNNLNGINIEFYSSSTLMLINDNNNIPIKKESAFEIYGEGINVLNIYTNSNTLLNKQVKLNEGVLSFSIGTSIFDYVDPKNFDNKLSQYFFRVRPLYSNKLEIIEVNSDTQTYCKIFNDNYCNFIIPLFNYDNSSGIYGYIKSEIPTNLKIYKNLVEVVKYESCKNIMCYSQFLNESKLLDKNYFYEKRGSDKHYLLIFVYSPIQNNIIFYHSINDQYGKRMVSPFSNHLLVLPKDKNLTIQFDNYDYLINIQGIDNEAIMGFDLEKNYIINRKSSYLIDTISKEKNLVINNKFENLFIGLIYYNVRLKKNINKVEFGSFTQSIIQQDFPYGYYTNIPINDHNEYIININIIDVVKENSNTRNIEFELNSYLINTDKLLKIKNNEVIDLSSNKIKGYFDQHTYLGKVFISKSDLAKNRDSTIIYTELSKSVNNKDIYKRVNNFIFVSSTNNTHIITPINYYINGNLESILSNHNVIYRLKKEKESHEIMYIEIAINNEKRVLYKLTKYPNFNEKMKYEKLSKNGKIYLKVNVKNDDSILLIFYSEKGPSINKVNNGFSFRYNTGLVTLKESNYNLKDEKVEIVKTDKNNKKLKLSIPPLLKDKNPTKGIYSIKEFEANYLLRTTGKTFALIEKEMISSKEYISNGESKIEIEFELKNLASIIFITVKSETGELFGYKSIYNPFNVEIKPTQAELEEENNKGHSNLIKLFLIIILALFLCIGLIIGYIYFKNKKNKDNLFAQIIALSMTVSGKEDKEETLIAGDNVNQLQ